MKLLLRSESLTAQIEFCEAQPQVMNNKTKKIITEENHHDSKNGDRTNQPNNSNLPNIESTTKETDNRFPFYSGKTRHPISNKETTHSPSLGREIVSVPLQLARLERLNQSHSRAKPAFEVHAYNGESSGVLQCHNLQQFIQWMEDISDAIHRKNLEFISSKNSTREENDLIHMVGWVKEYQDGGKFDIPRFLMITGNHILDLHEPPITDNRLDLPSGNGLPCKRPLFEVMFQFFAQDERDKLPAYYVLVQYENKPCICYLLETKSDFDRWNSTVQKRTHASVLQQRVKSYRCEWEERECELTIDFSRGFLLRDFKEQSLCWEYKFSQLKNSADDGKKSIKFTFHNRDNNTLESRELHCDQAYNLLFCVHSFLKTKLSLLDPKLNDGGIINQSDN